VIALIKNNKRPVAIDCANVACSYAHNLDNLGDGRGPVEAYKYWKRKGHKVKVFVSARKLFNKSDSKQVMANIEFFEEEIPLQDRIRIPPDADDDSYFISWAMNKDAFLVSNDLLRDHRERLKGEELEKFNSWSKNSRCGFIFVDNEFIVDPNFQAPEIVAVALEAEAVAIDAGRASTTTPPKPKHKRPEIPDEVIEDMRALSLSDKVLRETELDGELVVLKRERDESNSRTNKLRAERNAINQEVKEMIAKIGNLKDSRNQHNQAAKELKKNRELIDVDLKAARKKDGSKSNEAKSEESRKLKKKQEIAHKAVQNEVKKGNEFHELMMKKSKIVDKLRENANDKHQKMTASMENANCLHEKYILVLTTKFSLMDLIKAEKKNNLSQNREEVEVPNPPFLSDVLAGKEEEEISMELRNVLKEVLVEYSSKTKRRAHLVDRAGLSFKLDGHTLQISSKERWCLGILNENRGSITDTFLEKYDLGSFKMKLKKSTNK
tara:strand:+ start:206 stop:1690 length:1485 start_codon:yes stop_codon:yes gene_type:complete